jgi:hypothetical protein
MRRLTLLVAVLLSGGCCLRDAPAVDDQPPPAAQADGPKAIDLDVYESVLREWAKLYKRDDGQQDVFYVGFVVSKNREAVDPPSEFLKRFEGLEVKVKAYSEIRKLAKMVQDPSRVIELHQVHWTDANNGKLHIASWNEQMWCSTAWPNKVHREGEKWVVTPQHLSDGDSTPPQRAWR